MVGIAHDPAGGLFVGDIADPDTFCMSTEQIGEILATAFLKSQEAFLQALGFFIVISLVIGFVAGAGFVYLKMRLDAAESGDGE